MNDYTCDQFQCGLCSKKLHSIDDYVNHMVLEEYCIMVLSPCKLLHDLLLPRFVQDSSRCNEDNLSVATAVQIFTGANAVRWKCQLCTLTFSRRSAFDNHYSLCHTGTSKSTEASNNNKSGKNEPFRQNKPKIEIVDSNVPQSDNKQFNFNFNSNNLKIKDINADFHNTSDSNFCGTGVTLEPKDNFVLDFSNSCTVANVKLQVGDAESFKHNPNDNSRMHLTKNDPETLNSDVSSLLLENKPVLPLHVIKKKNLDESVHFDVAIAHGENTHMAPNRAEDDYHMIDLINDECDISTHDRDERDGDDVTIYDMDAMSCRLCSQTFKTVRTLQQHLSVVHAPKRLFVCTFLDCSLSFKTKGSLTRHYRRHTGERPFVCGTCGRSFRESGSLQRHQRCKISCAIKTDRQLSRYKASLPLPVPDCKSNVLKLLKKEEVVSGEDSSSGQVGVHSCLQDTVAEEAVPIQQSAVVLTGRMIKQERDRDVKDSQAIRASTTEPYAVALQQNAAVSTALLHDNNFTHNLLNIKKEAGNRHVLMPCKLRCKTEVLPWPASDEDGQLEEPDSPFTSNPPDSPSSVASLNPSLVEVPLLPPFVFPVDDDDLPGGGLMMELCERQGGDSVFEGGSFSPGENHDVKPGLSLATDVKPRITASLAVDVKPRLLTPTAAIDNNSNHNDVSTSNSSCSNNRSSSNGVTEPLVYVFNCPQCSRSFSARSTLMNHLYGHADLVGPQCSECIRQFSSRRGLFQHLVRHSSLRRLVCGECGQQCSHPSQLQQHRLSHSNNKPVLCGVCGRAFKTVSSRNLHARSHTGAREVCGLCGRAFSTRGSLQRHQRTHSGERPYQCQHCETTFREAGSLARHLSNKKPCCFVAKVAGSRNSGVQEEEHLSDIISTSLQEPDEQDEHSFLSSPAQHSNDVPSDFFFENQRSEQYGEAEQALSTLKNTLPADSCTDSVMLMLDVPELSPSAPASVSAATTGQLNSFLQSQYCIMAFTEDDEQEQ